MEIFQTLRRFEPFFQDIFRSCVLSANNISINFSENWNINELETFFISVNAPNYNDYVQINDGFRNIMINLARSNIEYNIKICICAKDFLSRRGYIINNLTIRQH
jgi:hypothetical protein